MAFDIKTLAPTATINRLGKPETGARSTKRVALGNIAKMVLIDVKKDGKRSF